MFEFQITGDRTEGNRQGEFLETRAWSRMFLKISNNNFPALKRTLHEDDEGDEDNSHPLVCTLCLLGELPRSTQKPRWCRHRTEDRGPGEEWGDQAGS